LQQKNELLSYFLNWKNMIHVLASLFLLLLLQENTKLTTITYQMLQRLNIKYSKELQL